jgi:hypothetical protein
MTEVSVKNSGAQVLELAGTGTLSPTIVLPRESITLSHGMPFQVIRKYGIEQVINHTGKRCKGCRWLHSKDTIVWAGACGKYVTVRSCLNMSPCEGPVRRDP